MAAQSDPAPLQTASNGECFFKCMSDQCRSEHISMFINVTGLDATASTICVVCAGCFFQTEIESIPLCFL